METKGLTCKIPLDLHNQISEEPGDGKQHEQIHRNGHSRALSERGSQHDGKRKNTGISGKRGIVPEDKGIPCPVRENLSPPPDTKGIRDQPVEQALEEAEEEFEAARAAAHESQQEQAESGPEAAECRDPDADASDEDNAQDSEVPPTEDDAERDLA